jgi:putative hydrolase of the HAD superfamily
VSPLASERRAARERALGLLYEAEVKHRPGTEVLAELPVAPDDLTVELVEAVDQHHDRIDELISRFSKGWSMSRMPAIDRAALRMGTAELIARTEVPTGVVLSETVDLASRFSTDASGRFVNGLLARIAREVRSDPHDTVVPDAGLPAEPPRPPTVDALIIDLDGVIRHWDADGVHELESDLGVPAGALPGAALAPERLQRAMDGRLPFDAWCQEVGEELARIHGADAAAVAEAWGATPWRIDLEVIDLVRATRSRVPVALLSNASTRLEEDLERSGILEEFDAVVGSAAIGVTKPDPAAFLAAADRLGAAPSGCLVVDDVEANVAGARAAGMRAEVYVGPDQLRSLLEEAALL